jgi:hypothetical protein
MIYKFIIYPVEIVYKALYLFLSSLIGSYGVSLIALSVVTTILILPFMRWANKMQATEKHVQDVMKPQLGKIKKESSGAEQHQRIKHLYYRYSYHPVMAIRSAAGVAMQLPFLMAAYYMLSHLANIHGQTFLLIKDLSKPDALLGGINFLPILMSVINIFSACTTSNFAKKDKIQAGFIALLFLVLLYDAPSALLVFWTCNNLWVLLGNLYNKVVIKFGIAIPNVVIAGRTPSEWIKNIPSDLCVIIGFATTICLFVPMDIYLTNANEFWFELSDIVVIMIKYSSIFIAVLGVVYKILPQRYKQLEVFILLCLEIGVFLQSYIINTNYGVLDGRTIEWEKYSFQAIQNIIVWVLCFVITYFLLRKIGEYKWRKIAYKVSAVFIAIQLVTLSYSGLTKNIDKRYKCQLTTDKMFELSSNENIVVLLLDHFDTKLFQRVLAENPEYTACLKDFTYYPDAISVFPLTDYSLPHMLTGKKYKNDMPYSEYIKQAWQDNKFYEILQENNYINDIYTNGSYVSPVTSYIDNLVTTRLHIGKNLIASYEQLLLFRIMPDYLKKYFVVYSGDFQGYSGKNDLLYTYNDVGFYKELKKGITINKSKKYFKFYHLDGAHAPYNRNRNMEYVGSGNVVSQYETALGSLKIVKEFLEQMQKHNVYKNATIMVLADHGKANEIVTSPLVLVKQPGQGKKNIYTSDNQISYEELLASLADRFHPEKESLGIPFSKVIKKNSKRDFYILQSGEKNKTDPGKIMFVKYEVIGNASKKESWSKVGVIKPSYTLNRDSEYKLGSLLQFTVEFNNGAKFLDNNWDRPEAFGTWSFGENASLKIKIQDFKPQQLELMINAAPYLTKEVPQRDLKVSVNDIEVAMLKLQRGGTFKIVIPKECTGDGTLNIKFNISDPATAMSQEHRPIGIFLNTLVIKPYDN